MPTKYDRLGIRKTRDGYYEKLVRASKRAQADRVKHRLLEHFRAEGKLVE